MTLSGNRIRVRIKAFCNKRPRTIDHGSGTGKLYQFKNCRSICKKENKQLKVLYLVPSIQLLTQTLRGWNDTELKITSMAVTSDRDASRGEDGTEDIKASDIGYPATTSKEKLLKNWEEKTQQTADMVVVFSTYQSIDVIGGAQKDGFPEFDLIISDEAHRTTGAHESSKEASIFSGFTATHMFKGERGFIKLLHQRFMVKVLKERQREKYSYIVNG